MITAKFIARGIFTSIILFNICLGSQFSVDIIDKSANSNIQPQEKSDHVVIDIDAMRKAQIEKFRAQSYKNPKRTLLLRIKTLGSVHKK